MSIIIETPQPPIRERLVLVREGEPMAPRRDAEPADLERAGWVEEHLLVTARAEMRELGSERDEVRLILDASAGETTADAATRLHNDWERAVDAISGRAKLAAAERERDEARAERDKLDAKLAQAEERGDLADQRAIDAIAERDEVRRQRDAEIASRDALARVLEQVERERDEARADVAAVERQMREARSSADASFVRANQMERERDEARAALATMTRQRDDATALASRLRCDLDRATDREDGLAAERARCVAWLRAEAASSDWASCATWGRALSDTADRIERGDHAGTPAPAALPRATDEELFAAYQTAYIVSCGVKDPSEDQRSITRVMPAERKGIAAVAARVRAEALPLRELAWASDQELEAVARKAFPHRVNEDSEVSGEDLRRVALAVAARVRREQCLVTRAVEAGLEVSTCGYVGPSAGLWYVEVLRRNDMTVKRAEHVPAADVHKTLARLLGEVTRG